MSSVIVATTTKKVRFGGERHAGWLPEYATLPKDMPVSEHNLRIEIEFDEDSFLLIYMSEDGSQFGDTWHESFENAKQAANDYFGIDEEDWQLPDATGTLAGLT